MEITDKLVKEITETAYLNQENTFRYRPIMRFFYQKHEQAENWLYKEDIYAELCSSIPNYTIEDCQRDLDFLVSKGSLTPVQDTENATTLDKFKFNNFRYQMTDYAVEIERLTIRLEELVVKVASLEPRLFERIKSMLKKVLNITTMTETDIYEMWNDLITDFENLNFNYQDFIKKFHEVRTEELLQNESFISKKNELIHYLEDFIKEYIVNRYGFDLNYDFEQLITTNGFTCSCEETVKQALYLLFSSNNFKEAVQKAISIGGDTDTTASITGSMAEALYGIPNDLIKQANEFLPLEFKANLVRGYSKIKKY